MDSVSATSAILKRILEKRIMLPVNPDKPPSEFKEGRFLIFIGGGNGSGKTTLSNFVFDELKKDGYDRDYIAEFGSDVFRDILSNKLLKPIHKSLLSYIEATTATANGSTVNHKTLEPSFFKKVALKTFQEVRRKAMEVGAPIVVDNHMDDPDFVSMLLKEAKENGYQTVMLTPHIDAEKIIPRLKERQNKTGKEYSSSKILLRHKKFAQNLEDYIGEFDLSVILNNNHDNCPPTVIAVAHKGEDIKVFDEETYAKVRKKEYINIHATEAGRIFEQSAEHSHRKDDISEPRTVGKSYREDHTRGKTKQSQGHFVRMIESDLLRVFNR